MDTFIAFLMLVSLRETYGHGQMYYPVDWYNQAGNGLTFGPKPESDYIFNFVGPYYPLPDEVCEGAEEGDAIECSPCRIQGCANYVYTNYTFIPGEPTLPDEMYDMDCATCLGIEETKRRKNPWTSPGSAPVYGEGCGANGGNPNGCMLPEVDNRPYGSCCVYNYPSDDCGAYNYGNHSTDHAAAGLFDDAAVTVWSRGTVAEVIWKTWAKHRGGYAYRLCKVGGSGIAGVTEECFQEGHLKFDGPYTWLMLLSSWTDVEATIKKTARRTTEGTNPPGSEWASFVVPNDEVYVPEYGWGIKDLVQVPESLEPGRYVLSFRWDTQNTPQVWNTCANIEIV